MPALDIAKRLEGFKDRGAGTDAERRAALWLADHLSGAGRDAQTEPFWCRPNWPLAHAWHAALALAGSLIAEASPRVGGGLLIAALVSIVFDALLGVSLGRRLTPERASQNVVQAPGAAADDRRLRVILTANYDAARTGIVYRDSFRRPWARLRRLTRGRAPGWLAWLVVAIVWLEIVAILRVEGHKGVAISVLQLPPTIAVVLALAALLEFSSSRWSPSAGDNATGVGIVLALARAMQAAPPRNVDLQVVLTGAGDATGIGLRHFLRSHRADFGPANTVVLGVAACGDGRPSWWRSDGSLLALRYAKPLRQLAADLAAQESYLGAQPSDGRGQGPAFPARLARIPAITIGCLDADGVAPRSHQAADRSESIDPAALDAAVQFGLMLVDAIDAELAQRTAVDAVERAVGD